MCVYVLEMGAFMVHFRVNNPKKNRVTYLRIFSRCSWYIHTHTHTSEIDIKHLYLSRLEIVGYDDGGGGGGECMCHVTTPSQSVQKHPSIPHTYEPNIKSIRARISEHLLFNSNVSMDNKYWSFEVPLFPLTNKIQRRRRGRLQCERAGCFWETRIHTRCYIKWNRSTHGTPRRLHPSKK